MTIMIVFTLCVVGTITFKTRHVGRELYPESAYPYQGKIMIGTNAVPEPKW